MSKININFNNKNYNIDEVSLSTSINDLKSHLSKKMNGSGAVIVLNGQSYNVDSTKLQTAKNEFIAHLGTIAGTDYKIIINGIEYFIDANKITDAINGMETVLDELNNSTETDNVAILDEAILDYATLA